MQRLNGLNFRGLGGLEKYSTWITLGVFTVVILAFFIPKFSVGVPTYSNTEYMWSVDVSRGVNIYPQEEGFIEGRSCAYMPLYFLVTGNLMKVFGTSPTVGKVVSTLAAFGIAFLIYKIGVKLTDRKFLSIIPGVLFLLYPAIVNYSAVQVKIDILGLLFAALSLYLVLNRHYLWAVPFAVLALFTKQMFIAVPMATIVYLAWRDRNVLLEYVGLCAVLTGIGFGIGQLLTDGTFFTHTVLYMFAPQFGEVVLDRTLVGTLICLGYLIPVLVLAIYGMRKTRQFGFLGIYLVVAFVVMMIMIGKVGSGINYTFEALVACCCLSVLAVGRKNAGDWDG